MSLRLPPNLEEPSRECAVAGHVVRLLPQAKERLRQLCRLEDLRPGRVVGRGERGAEAEGRCCIHFFVGHTPYMYKETPDSEMAWMLQTLSTSSARSNNHE